MKQSELKALIKECYNEVLAEKAYSVAQQQAAGAALAAKKGKAPESGLKGASKAMEKMTTKELEKIASTKHKGLPKHVKENEEMDLPDTRKVYMGDEPSKIDLGVDKRMSANIDKIGKQIENLTNELKPLIAAFNVAQKELQSKLASKQITKDEYDMQRSLIAKNYDEATKGLVASLKKAKLADEVMLAKLK